MHKAIESLLREYIAEVPILSEGLQQHVVRSIPISEPIFRPGSDQFFSLIREARAAWKKGQLSEDVSDPWVLEELELGEWGIYEGRKVPLDFPVPESIDEAEYQGRKVELGKPFRVSGGGHKFAVYVRDPKTKKIKKVQFGSPGLKVKLNNPARRKSFAARHRCEQKNDKMTPGYWACRIGRYPKLFGGDTYYKWW
jgi:hypothetical protein